MDTSCINTVIECGSIALYYDSGLTPAEVVQPKFVIAGSAIEAANVGSVIASIPVVLDKMFLKPEDSVKADTSLGAD